MLSTICQVLVAGIAAKFLYKNWFSPKTKDSGSSTVSLDHNHGSSVSLIAVSVSSLAHDLLIFEITSQVYTKIQQLLLEFLDLYLYLLIAMKFLEF